MKVASALIFLFPKGLKMNPYPGQFLIEPSHIPSTTKFPLQTPDFHDAFHTSLYVTSHEGDRFPGMCGMLASGVLDHWVERGAWHV